MLAFPAPTTPSLGCPNDDLIETYYYWSPGFKALIFVMSPRESSNRLALVFRELIVEAATQTIVKVSWTKMTMPPVGCQEKEDA